MVTTPMAHLTRTRTLTETTLMDLPIRTSPLMVTTPMAHLTRTSPLTEMTPTVPQTRTSPLTETTLTETIHMDQTGTPTAMITMALIKILIIVTKLSKSIIFYVNLIECYTTQYILCTSQLILKSSGHYIGRCNLSPKC